MKLIKFFSLIFVFFFFNTSLANESLNRQLIDAAMDPSPFGIKKRIERIHKLIEVGADVNIKDLDGNTLLHLVEHPYVLEALLERGADLNAVNKDGLTPLHTPWNVSTILYYIEGFERKTGKTINFDIDAKDNGGNTPLNLLSATLMTPLESFGISPGPETQWIETQKIQDAVLKNSLANFNGRLKKFGNMYLLLKKGARVNTQNNEGKTPLHRLLSYPIYSTQEMKLLVKKGADIDRGDAEGLTPLHQAIGSVKMFSGNLKGVEFLVQKGAKVNKKDKNGIAPIIFASQLGLTSVVLLLKDRLDIDLTVTDEKGRKFREVFNYHHPVEYSNFKVKESHFVNRSKSKLSRFFQKLKK